MKTTPVFEKAYACLDPRQKEAVDTVEGPVLVIAGPGTGKTHILTLRIANILAKTQAVPESILALTFTESAARNMRRRLVDIIGEIEAQKVTITTFHGFAELVRMEYREYFTTLGTKRLAGDIEKTLLMRQAIETADISIIRPSKAPYYYLKDLESLHDTLVRENMSLESFRAWGVEQKQACEADESLQHKKGKQAGTLTKLGLDVLAKYDRVEEATLVFERYELLKEEYGVYDFSDILRITVDTVTKQETLRADLMERFQYILADEHQDANALQHHLLELFAYDDVPNLFVVGDAKQAIYRFQGADLGGFTEFTTRFPSAKVVTLSTSFRSIQHILDTSHSVIESTGKHERLASSRDGSLHGVFLMPASDPLDERTKVVTKIDDLITDGVPPHEIAIIVRTNESASLFAKTLSACGIPALRAGDLSLTGTPLMRTLMALMTYVGNPSRINSLRIALLAPWWNVPAKEMLILLNTSYDKELVVRLGHSFPQIAKVLAESVSYAQANTPAECFSLLFSASGARDYFLSHAEHFDEIALIRRLMMHLEEAAVLKEAYTFSEAMTVLHQALEHGLSPVKVSATEREGHITVITAHKAKGMEFEHVFVANCTEQGWEKGGKRSALPSPFDDIDTHEDARRLFYVALTRAKNCAYLSYAVESAEGRERELSTLVPPNLDVLVQSSEPLPTLHTNVSTPKVVKEVVEVFLSRKGLSPSSVNEYLDSPATFFVRRVLRLHEPPIPALVYGNAVHASIAELLAGASIDDAERILYASFNNSLLPRDGKFQNLQKDAHDALVACAQSLKELGEVLYIEKAFSLIQSYSDGDVVLGGKVDAVFKTAKGLCVVDFKTGSSVSAKNDGYARQLALYASLLESNGEDVTEGALVQISPKGMKKVPVPIESDERKVALADVDTVVAELRSGQWRRGEVSEYDVVLELLK